MEFVLASDDMTTEVIADGRHLAPELLRFILKMLGPDRVALVTDCEPGAGPPPGEYISARSMAASRSTATARSA